MLRIRRVTTKGWWTVLFGIVGQAICTGQGLSLPNGDSLISPQNLSRRLASSLQAMGARMQTPDMAQVTLVGTVTDTGGSRSAQIMVQAPGLWAYREGANAAITFDGTKFQTKSGQLTAGDVAVSESLLAHLPDSVFLQLAFGGGLRRIGSHFRTDDGKSKTYSSPYWTVFAFSPMSPALRLGHELAHAAGPAASSQTIGPPYDTPEERRVITGPERSAATALGECVRHEHDFPGNFNVPSPIMH